jgi:hypothetical protein
LLTTYDVPRFLDAAWRAGLTTESVLHQEWFKLLGAGRSLRTADGLPLPLTRRMAHHLAQAPAHFDVRSALRYAQVRGLGGDEGLACSLTNTRLGTDFSDHDFWETVIRWLIDHPEVEPRRHGPVIDYLHYRKFVPSVSSGLGRGRPRLAPAQPHLCMRGRRAENLLEEVERWHRVGPALSASACWEPSGIPPLLVEETLVDGRKVYAITELLCSAELEEEGQTLHHCVATYRALCQSGQSSIWSLTREDDAGRVERLLTVEVRNWRREIVQARGTCNRGPQPEEVRILTRWAHVGGPTIAPYVLC